jgi:hypothetical protein
VIATSGPECPGLVGLAPQERVTLTDDDCDVIGVECIEHGGAFLVGW